MCFYWLRGKYYPHSNYSASALSWVWDGSVFYWSSVREWQYLVLKEIILQDLRPKERFSLATSRNYKNKLTLFSSWWFVPVLTKASKSQLGGGGCIMSAFPGHKEGITTESSSGSKETAEKIKQSLCHVQFQLLPFLIQRLWDWVWPHTKVQTGNI